MRPHAVVVVTPTFDLFACLAERIKCFSFKLPPPDIAAKAFDVGVLGGFPGSDVVQAHMLNHEPRSAWPTRELRPDRRESSPARFLTFSNGAVANGRYWTVWAGNQSGEKPYNVTRFGSGRG